MNRRYFLMGSLATTAIRAVRAKSSPNDTVRIAVVGCGGRGASHMGAWTSMPNVELAGLVDVDDSHSERYIGTLVTQDKKAVPTFRDMRKVLDDKNIDAISIATPESLAHAANHLGLPGRQGRVRREALLAQRVRVPADRRGRAQVQSHGADGQPEPLLAGAAAKPCRRCATANSARSTWPAGCVSRRATPSARRRFRPCRPGVDYDMWTGPSPLHPFTKNRFHYNWHWFWDTGNGDLGNQGIHEVDIARWGLGVTHPTKVSAIGGKFMFDDDQETPNTLTAATSSTSTASRR